MRFQNVPCAPSVRLPMLAGVASKPAVCTCEASSSRSHASMMSVRMVRTGHIFIPTNGCRFLAEFFRSHSEDRPICGQAPGMQSHACVTSVPSWALYFSLPLSTTSTSSVHRQSSVFPPCSPPNIVVGCKENRDAKANPQHPSCINRDEYGEW
jgi:hypothetical protein